MENKIKQSIPYIACAAMGLLTFIFFIIPYLTAFAEVMGYEAKDSISGYKVMDLWDSGFSGVMCSILQIFVLVTAVVLIAYGALGLLKIFAGVNILPDAPDCRIASFALYAYSALNILLLVFMIIFTASNTDKSGYASAGVRLSAGIFITLIFSLLASAAGFFGNKLNAKVKPSDEYICSKCGKASKEGVNFCNSCGGEIVKKQ